MHDDIYLDEMKFSTDLTQEQFQDVFFKVKAYTLGTNVIKTTIFVRLISEIEEACSTYFSGFDVPLFGEGLVERYRKQKKAERRLARQRAEIDEILDMHE